jgi:hypothetical protein
MNEFTLWVLCIESSISRVHTIPDLLAAHRCQPWKPQVRESSRQSCRPLRKALVAIASV